MVEEGVLDTRVSDKSHALTSSIIDNVENDVFVSEAARAVEVLANDYPERKKKMEKMEKMKKMEKMRKMKKNQKKK